MNTDGTGFYTCKECHQTESLWNHITTDHKEGEQLEDRRNVGESSCKSGDGTDQMVQYLMVMMMKSKPYRIGNGSGFMQHFSYAYIFIWVRKLDSDSLTETKNWSGRNEVIETSSRLHPLWPQNKRLRTPWTADWMHTGQDRWIQTELAFTLAKNTTKPNPFEIISLQTTRKENNWKTEETLARTVVTLETERIRGSNPWCLWWWWTPLFESQSNYFSKSRILVLTENQNSAVPISSQYSSPFLCLVTLRL